MYYLIKESFEHFSHMIVRDHLDEHSKFKQEVVFESKSLEAVKDHRKLVCAKESLWYPGRPFQVFMDGAYFDSIGDLARDIGINVPKLKRLLQKYRAWILPWPDSMGDMIDGFCIRNPLCK